jgi:uncharacterized protein YukE
MTQTSTQLGGDPASIRAVATWFRDILAPRVKEAASVAAHILNERLDAWEDAAARAFAEQLRAGHRKAEELAEAIKKRADLLDEIANTLEQAEELMAEADRLATLGRLRREGGWIYAPAYGESVDAQPENNTPEALEAYYNSRLAIWEKVEALTEQAYEMVRTKLIGDDSYDWNTLIFRAGDFVKETVSELVAEAKQTAVAATPLLLARERPTPSFLRLQAPAGHYGLTSRVLTAAGPILIVTGAAYELYRGNPPERVVLTTGVGLGGGPAALWFARALGFGSQPWTAAAITVVGSFFAAEVAGWAYDNTRTARDKLLRTTPDVDPGPRPLPD